MAGEAVGVENLDCRGEDDRAQSPGNAGIWGVGGERKAHKRHVKERSEKNKQNQKKKKTQTKSYPRSEGRRELQAKDYGIC